MDTGFADFVVPVEKMPEQLVAYSKRIVKKILHRFLLGETTSALQKILLTLRSQTGHDFSHYKKTTILRRIEKRMGLHQYRRRGRLRTLYSGARRGDPGPLQGTSDPRDELLPGPGGVRRPDGEIPAQLLDNKPETYFVRVWVPGCATGEEAYSIAILLRECMRGGEAKFKVQIFGTDIDEDSIGQARTGLYPANISQDVSAQRLKRHFVKEDAGYRIRKRDPGDGWFSPSRTSSATRPSQSST